MKKFAFVTVGSTKFDELIEAVDDIRVAEVLAWKGYQELVIQRGNGEYQMKNLMTPDLHEKTLENGLVVKCFDYAPTVAHYIKDSSLIICHAGAGSIFEGLRAGKVLLVVPNARLMHNHQVELAQRLEQDHYLFSTSPESLFEKLKSMDETQLIPYEADNPRGMVERIDKLFPRI